MIIVSIPIESQLITLKLELVKSIAITTRNIRAENISNFLARGFVKLSQKKNANKQNSTNVNTPNKYIYQVPGKYSTALLIINDNTQLNIIIWIPLSCLHNL